MKKNSNGVSLFTENSSFYNILISVIESRDLGDTSHSLRISLYTEILLKCLLKSKKYNLTQRDIKVYADAAILHDIGKLMIPEAVLLKKGRFTPKEHEIMKLHSIRGAQIIESMRDSFNEDCYQICYDICKYHHERWDGSGYPKQLQGEEIPFGARVVAIADVYDALTSAKPYKPRLPHKTAVEMITNGDCGMFDPAILECFKTAKNDFEKVSIKYFGEF